MQVILTGNVSMFITCRMNRMLNELRSCVKVEVAILGSPSLLVRAVSVNVKQQ